TDEHGFISIHPETATRTSDSTVFAAGGSTGPVDLVEASMGAMAAAAEVLETLPPEWPGYPPRIIVIGGGPAAEGADSAMRAAGAEVSMVLGAPGKGLQRLEGEPLGFLAKMGSPGSEPNFKLKGDIVIIVPDRGGAFYEPVPDEAGTVAILMSDGPEALLLASDLMESRPGVHVHVLFREMQVATMGMQELQLDLAGKGVGFHRYKAGSLKTDRGLGGDHVMRFVDELSPELDTMDLVVQHVARPLVEHKEDLVWPWFLSRYAPLGVPPRPRLNVLPVLTPRRGVYTTTPATATTTAATLGGPAAAAMALSDYARGFTLMDEVAVVDPAKCAACLSCLRLCPHDAIVFVDEDRAARVMVRACQNCGVCRGICPAEAIEMVPRDELEAD
ncbi:MAG: 4Fe-4S binding protein, partial [Thermoplasmata archaeon]|nr:4Fe-4S binding protein [Thermoplasmata archaeon]